MPIDFVEESVRASHVELFDANSKARPLHLEGEVIPHILARAGDEKAQTLSIEQVQAYLDKNVLIFDSSDLKNMFKEADYKKEGVLGVRALSAAISGRYPKRRMTGEWRQLVCMLLELPELVLASDIIKPKASRNGVFNAESLWDSPPPELPRISWNKIKSSSTLPLFRKPQSYSEQSGSPLTLTASGLKNSLPYAQESSINDKLSGSRSTFGAVEAFNNFSKGLEVQSSLSLKPSDAEYLYESTRHQDPDWAWKTSPKPSFKAYSAVLPPTGVTLNSSALATLRTAVGTTRQPKPVFLHRSRPLTTTEEDMKKTLGTEKDPGFFLPLSRVEPTRPTSRKFDASYLELGSYSKCRTMPSFWYNEHPSLPESVRTAQHKFPWGEWGVGGGTVRPQTSPQAQPSFKETRSSGGGAEASSLPIVSRPQTAASSQGQFLTADE